jgi:hypothetical protein
MTSQLVTWLDARPVRPMPLLLRALPLLLTSALALFFVVDTAALPGTHSTTCVGSVYHATR